MVTVPSEEKKQSIAIVVNEGYEGKSNTSINWAKVNAYVAIATTITAAGITVNSSFVQKALVSYASTFLAKLSAAFGKAGLAATGMSVGIFANAQSVMAAENNPGSVDAQAVNDAVSDFETALEVLLGVDSMDEVLDAIEGVDAEEVNELIEGIQNENGEYEEAGEAQPPRDPLIIDLGESGIELCSLTEGVNFDLDRNGYAEKTAWIGVEDGFLALDRDENGTIDHGGELFGDQVVIGDGVISSSGFEALSVLDENADGRIDEMDDCYSKLLVWVDANHNGISETEELCALSYYNIKEIQLDHTEESIMDENTGTMMAEYSKVVYQDATETVIGEFWFPVNTSDTTQGDVITAGNVPSIEQAMLNDQTGELIGLVNAFVEEKNIELKRYYIKKILYFITDSNNIEPNSRGGNIDARDLHVIERFMGRDFNGVGGSNPNSNAAYILNDIYMDIEDYYYNILNLYAEFGGYKSLMFECEDENGTEKLDVTCLVYVYECLIEQGKDMDTLIYDLGIYLKSYDKIHGTNHYADYCNYYEGMSDEITEAVNATKDRNVYMGTGGADYYYGISVKNYIYGEDGDDNLSGNAYNDYISGNEGNDILFGGYGDDKLCGNAEDDGLYAGI